MFRILGMRQSGNALSHQIELQRVRLLYGAGSSMFVGGAVAIFAYAWVARLHVATWELQLWLAYMVVAFTFRVATHLIFRKSTSPGFDFNWRRYEFLHALGLFLTASGWGAAGSVLLPADQDVEFCLGIIIVALIAGGASTYAVSKRSTFAVMVPMAVPFSIALGYRGSEADATLGVLIQLFMILMIGSAFKRRDFTLQAWAVAAEKDRLAQDLIEMQEAAKQSAKMAAVGRLAAGIAHEINTPLAIISLSAQSIQDSVELGSQSFDESSKVIQENTAQIESTIIRISKIIGGLRTFSQTEQSPSQLEAQDPDLHQETDTWRKRFRDPS